ncbi:MAG TPA: serine/threonine-protein kinase, partial [Gemmatimonadales bacterium]|nr:serine/threonine-protein kinase [Gemmatimonadales bacterium]
MTPDLRQQLQRSLGDAYQLEHELGGGGMSRVFVATERAFGRQVVVKVLLPELAAGVSVDRFRREIQLAAQLQHPHIVPLLSAGESEGLPYFTMPFVIGESLRARLFRDRELPVPEAIRLLRDVASALDYAHSRGVVHRDIKPDNVLITHGVAVVTDFGVAKALTASAGGEHAGITSMGVTLGTPTYMAPEQASADPNMDHRVDVYAFGIMAYEMLTGSPPFTGRSPQAVLGAHLVSVPEPVTKHRPGLPPGLSAMIMRCLQKHAADRPQTAGDLMAMLDTLTTPSGGTVPIIPTTQPMRRSSGAAARQGRQWGTITAVGVALLAFAVWIWSSRPSGRPVPSVGSAESAGSASVAEAPEAAPAAAAAAAAAADSAPDSSAGQPSAASTLTPPVTAKSATRRPLPGPPPAKAARPGVTDASLMTRLRSEAKTARQQATDHGVEADVLARGDSAVKRADSLELARRITEAAAELSVAIAVWRNAPAAPAVVPEVKPPPVVAPEPPSPAAANGPPAAPPAPVTTPAAPQPPPDPSPRVRALFAEYAGAIETRSVPAIRQVYPGLTDKQASDWTQFFKAVSDVKVQLQMTRLDVRGDV